MKCSGEQDNEGVRQCYFIANILTYYVKETTFRDYINVLAILIDAHGV